MLKQSFLALAALGVLSSIAVAADAVSDVPAAPVVEDVAPAFSWGGFYAGVSGGYGWERVTASVDGETVKGNFNGGRFAGFTGYNFEVAPSVILGGEADVGYAWGNKTVDGDKVSAGLNGSVRLRAGYAFDRALIYTAGGYTATDSEVKSDAFGKSSRVLHGWTVGAGVDYAFTDNVFGRLEYRYNDFGKETYTIAGESFRGGLSDHVVNVGLGVKF
ncbi:MULTISPECIES: outer membrane protein [Agrobacterium]|uniref:Porin family protein n=1 Tax=Agrobacterium tumefaciens TaxID=358 RepID=A0AAE6BDZ8_AGRTU|nr:MULTISPECIES: outer membrane protein [Agrobacterium]QCL75146.1 porin family protein [Agrobacterium tumefaciens]QCL80707.1 porin family protein [Agrobacterium tumefaciens]CUX62083.1 25 kDa outer-membrane immunogenic protein [Agrobacterium sp. NCPPB 925]